ncbi:MAG: UDP-N-acetylmuramoyl-tripeptide--D-alanyl-D-alanine ligase [Verrucomicrobiae bacterium]|nr:UDP-N-acetylmuramoyl-tripeptide--D-alanyl-D-alanine ligase [Verrucomicrobiae bacterium]MCX7722734.1 UDP-N-acetylmuramoyl-tripeptide--D-alanyl-D-alanine ligase [Verrucomicrobiae bacterium]MDW7981135.1 UDP-N-acetylmuramoyl-tripeptide--D-alanyl-D-alanine ligase [Verrucomicrobiales bacterium]
MEKRPIKFVVEACGGELVTGNLDTSWHRVCTDSRRVEPGDLFFALKGENFDGHEFVPEAVKRGAVGVVVRHGFQHEKTRGQCAVVVVDDTRAALGRLAAKHRAELGVTSVAVCGSNGKTTVKELLAAVLRQQFNTHSSPASYNNDIGVPLTLLGLTRAHQMLVAEAGTNHPGELAPLIRMIQPQIGVLTNVGREHMEFFGDLAGVAQEEGQLAELLPSDGLLVLDGDNDWASYMAARTRARVVRVGLSDKNDWRATDIQLDNRGVSFNVAAPRKEYSGRYRVNLIGRHQVINALFAIAVGEELGLGRADIQRGLAECRPAPRRMQLYEKRGVWVLDDSYNANPDSMRMALRTLAELPCSGRRVAVLGDMAEQGEHSVAAHIEVGRLAAELGIGQLFAVGKMAPVTAQAARAAGLTRVMEFTELEAASCALRKFVRPGDLVLLKASRVARLERLAEAICNPEAQILECCFI